MSASRQTNIRRGLSALWPPIRLAFGWVHQAAHILGREGADKQAARKRLGGLLGAMARHRDKAGGLAPA